ncbi:efflux RND transporter periplasmic adaptor subunit [Burkholderia sp. SCN-KJ]|uniref:efflux RND transporter periplasmic adaptor subunit n=1 Tax=Burkholderia sp. SCN-KJ TaxID=2969248 RepID=UPI0021500756|nr:efflux RND transporter periplasmic adaptor subunit [Burkholderia sp. SCN-KJ]MCR4470017.1 efflux RND transporter periplasmic adaptor subunit [Burkholderia sp. SCN-KJ]
MRFRTSAYLGTSVAAVVIASPAHGKEESTSNTQIPEIGFVTANSQAEPISIDLPGRTSAYLVAQASARGDGIILRGDFVEGSEVRVGQRFYKIDLGPCIAKGDIAKAAPVKMKVNLITTNDFSKCDNVFVTESANREQDYENTVFTKRVAAVNVPAGKAKAEMTQINLYYTDVTAPVSDRTGISLNTRHAYVKVNRSALTNNLRKIKRAHIGIAPASLDGLKHRRKIQRARLKTCVSSAVKVTWIPGDARDYSPQGASRFSDATVDHSTGSITLRAVFKNSDHILLPVMLEQARIEKGVDGHEFAVPVVGVTHDQNGHVNALAIGPDSNVLGRSLTMTGMFDTCWIVDSGLQSGDRVIVRGIGKVHLGMMVQAVPSASAATLSGSPVGFVSGRGFSPGGSASQPAALGV